MTTRTAFAAPSPMLLRHWDETAIHPSRLRAVNPAANQGRKEAVFIDAGLDNVHLLASTTPAGIEVATLSGRHDGLAQWLAWAALAEGYDALHLLCHGAPGRLTLGNGELSAATLDQEDVQDALRAIGLSLRAGGAVFLYGCNTAQGEQGQAFVDALARALGVPVMAASHVVGASDKGGNWRLDYASAAVSASALAWPDYTETLVMAQEITTFEGLAAGTVNFASTGPVYAPGTTITAQNVANTGWDVTAQSSVDGTPMHIRGHNSDSFNYGDGDGTALRVFSYDVDYVIFKANASSFYFDLTSFAFNNTYAASFTVQAINAAGELTGTAVPFTHAGNGGALGGAYTLISLAGNPDFVGIYGFKLTFTTVNTIDVNSDFHPTGIDAPFFDNIVIANVIAAPPTTTVATVKLSSDTGSNTTDFITRTASQTFSGTLSAPLATGETVQVSFDNGDTWVDATATVGETTWSIAHTLTDSNTFQARIANSGGTSTALSQAYVLDTTAPTGLALSQSSTTATAALAGATLGTLSATDAHAVTYALATGDGSNDIDNGKFAISGNNLVIGSAALSAGSYKVYLAAIDVAGNISYLPQTITVQSVPSVVSIVRSSSADEVLPASATSATYTVTFSEDVNGVTADDFTVTPIGTASGTVSAVSGSGTTYTVTVSGISGDGTLRLDLKSSGTGIESASTSVPISGGYTGGATYTVDHTAPATSSTPDLVASSDTGNTTDNITADNTPTFTGTAEAGASVTLYDTDGTTVLGTATATGGTWSITSSPLSDGEHQLSVKVTDKAGNVSAASDPLTVHIDTASPTSLALSTTTTSVSNATANATVATLSAVDANTITYTLVTSGGNGADNDKFVIEGNLLKVAGDALAAGNYSIQIKATDLAGNAVIKTQTITVQNAPSVVSIVRSNSADEILPASATSATYTVTFSEAVTGVTPNAFTVTADGTASGTVYAVSGSGTTYTVTVSGISGDGTLRLDLKSSGTGIESASTSVPISGGYTGGATYTLDHTPPAASSTPDLAASSDTGNTTDNITADNTPTFTGTAEAGATVTLYDTDGTTVLGTATATGGTWSITSSPLSDGEHQLSVKVTDKAGNVSAASDPLTVHIDTTAPTNVILDTPSIATSNAIAGATVTSLSADDANAISYALVSGNGDNDSENYLFVIVGNTLQVGPSPLSAGTYHIYLKATDTAGNATQVAKTITVANAPFVSSIVRADAAGSILPASENSAIFTVTFNQAVSEVDASDFELSGAASGTISGISGSGTTYTVTVTGISGDGALRLDLKASGTGIKNADNIVIAGGYTGGESYTIDRTAPSAPAAPALAAASNTGDTTDSITSDNTPTLTGTAETGATVTLYDTDGTTVLGTTTATDGTWSITSSALTEGGHTLTVKATDAAGNVSAASQPLTVTIDTSAPAGIALSANAAATASAIAGATIATLSAVDANSITYALVAGDGSNDAGNGSFIIDGNVLKVGSTPLAAGIYNIYLQATDIAGNTGYVARTITVADAPAVASIVRANGAGELLPAHAGTAIFTVTFSQAVTGVDASDFVLSGTAGGTIGKVTGSGTTYTVSVTGISGEGALRLDLKASGTGIRNGTGIDIASGYTGGASYTVEPPPPVTPSPSPDVDGMPVTHEPVTLPGGGSGTQVVVPVVPPSRADSSGDPSVADIPLVTENGSTTLLAQLPVGYGLTSMGGPSRPVDSAGASLLAAIVAATPGHQAGDQGHLTGNGSQFLQGLQGNTPLLVHTVTPVTAPSGATGALTLTGTSTANQRTALVIDGSQLPAGASINLNSVDFAAVIGAVNVRGNTSGQFLSGDGAAQTFTVSNGLGSQVFAGAGDDTLGIETAGAAARTLAASTTVLHGGLDSDTAVFNGARADYDIEQHEGYLVVSHKSQPGQKVLLINVESLTFDDATIAVQYSGSLAAIAGLYNDALGRQADYTGIDYWATLYNSGMGLGTIALGLLQSDEGRASHGELNGDAMHDLQVLYAAILGREADAEGLAYWAGSMAQGMTLEQVADAFMQSAEGAQHLLAATQWNFFV